VDWLLDARRALGGGDPRLVLDVGANVGQTTRLVKHRFPRAVVHAFEPIGSTFEALQAGVGSLPGVTCHRLALSDRSGSLSIQTLPKDPRNSLTSTVLHDAKGLVQETVTLVRLDAFLAERGIQGVDILKTDTEGHEMEVLRGSEETLRRGDVKCVYVEVTFNKANRHHTLFDRVSEMLLPLGFRFAGLYETENLLHPTRDFEFCNALFVRPPSAA
jgi:FkbM family methyltransferase